MKKKPHASKVNTKSGLFQRLAVLYQEMEAAYAAVAKEAGPDCRDCPQNCCSSYFTHHTFIEWHYLWRGLAALPPAQLALYTERAKDALARTVFMLEAGQTPDSMCPLNNAGLCGMYEHRLMICRMHGTRNCLNTPDGRQQIFTGCFRFGAGLALPPKELPLLDRTPFYQQLATLEQEMLARATRKRPERGSHTIAAMIVHKPPILR